MSPSLEQALATYPDWSYVDQAAQPRVVSPVGHGLSNHAFLVHAGQDCCVLRLSGADEEVLGLNRHAECSAIRAAERINLAPRVFYCDPQQGILVTEFVEGTHWDGAFAAGNIERIALLLKKIHSLPAVPQNLIPMEKATHYWHSLQVIGFSPGDPLLSLRSPLDRLMAEAGRRYPGRCCCHNDLLPGNIIAGTTGTTGTTGTAGLTVIDWEYAAMNDPYFDLAAVATGFDFNAEQIDCLLQSYAGEVNNEVRQHYQASATTYLYLETLWYFIQGAVRADQGLSAIAAEKLNQLSRVVRCEM